MTAAKPTALVDKFGRRVDYVRISVTDRCDFRCVYCMSETMTFLPRNEVLTLEELYRVANAFVSLGVSKVRITGGEPLIRKNILSFLESTAALEGLDELNITTNGSQLEKMAPALKQAGVNRLNISLDSLKADTFKALTRTGDLAQVIRGIDHARAAGFDNIKINSVILKGRNEDEIFDLVDFCIQRQMNISFIEEMPLGLIDEHDRSVTYCSSDEIQALIENRYGLQSSAFKTVGPSVYFDIPNSNTSVGFISPHSHNFCHLCNRVRLTVEGRLLLCLGNEHSIDLKPLLRNNSDDELLCTAIIQAMDLKPEKHYFDLDDSTQILRFMNTTGG